MRYRNGRHRVGGWVRRTRYGGTAGSVPQQYALTLDANSEWCVEDGYPTAAAYFVTDSDGDLAIDTAATNGFTIDSVETYDAIVLVVS